MKREISSIIPCPCHSGELYKDCCEPFHKGKYPKSSLELMRSRYAAYALCISEYIVQTTHPKNPQYNSDIDQWIRQIDAFSAQTEFKNLEIHQVHEDGLYATVTFTAHLFQDQKEVSFTEKSAFEKVNGIWLYRSGIIK